MVQEGISILFLIWSSGSPPVQWSETTCVIMKEGIIGNIHVKIYEILDQCLRRRCRLKKKFTTDGRTTDEDRSQ